MTSPATYNHVAIVHIEDDEATRYGVLLTLRDNGFTNVRQFSSLVDAEPALASADIVLSDLRLAKSDPPDTIQFLLCHYDGQIAALTGLPWVFEFANPRIHYLRKDLFLKRETALPALLLSLLQHD